MQPAAVDHAGTFLFAAPGFHSLTSSHVNTPVASHNQREACHADVSSPMSTATSVSRSMLVHALVALARLAALSACGPAPSDEASNLAASASQPLGTGQLLREASGLSPSGIPEPVPSAATTVAPARWAQQGPNAPLDPLVVALEDGDETVQTKALQMIEQDWMRAQAAAAQGEP